MGHSLKLFESNFPQYLGAFVTHLGVEDSQVCRVRLSMYLIEPFIICIPRSTCGISKVECDFEMKYYLIIAFFSDDHLLCPSYFSPGLYGRPSPTEPMPYRKHFHSFQTFPCSVAVPGREISVLSR